ncbi:MAG TPA: hypothetical protein VEI02_06975 [Planctomycetota bacterium]|nr:hypothetical protein [Planctomycetota bacterium]
MKTPEQTIQEQVEAERLLEQTLHRMNRRVLGLTLGALSALGLFAATLTLVVKDAGKPDMGAHLGLLCQFFPGYSVTFGGAFIGAAWAFVAGFLAGNVLSRVYNLVSSTRSEKVA